MGGIDQGQQFLAGVRVEDGFELFLKGVLVHRSGPIGGGHALQDIQMGQKIFPRF